MENQFLKAVNVGGATTQNGAASYATTGSAIVDQFGKAGSYRDRNITEVFADQSAAYAENPLYGLRLPFYLRMVSRKVKGFEENSTTEKIQNGQGAKDESFKRFLWLAKYQPEVFYKNLWVLPLVGCWKDLWKLMVMDDSLDKTKFFEVIQMGIESDSQRELVKKYLPRIRSNQKVHTDWAIKSNKLAKDFCKYAGWTYQVYKEFKSTGKAHEFQRIISEKRYDDLKWNTIPGKALFKLVTSTKENPFLERHNLIKSYSNWLETQPTVKFNGYAYELGHKISSEAHKLPLYKKITLDKQFDELIRLGKENNGGIKGNVWCAIDTSGSMNARIGNSDITAYDVCVSLGIYFSNLNEGAFHDHVIMFDDNSKIKKLKGSFTDKWLQIKTSETAWGSTNFQSVINEIVRVRMQHPNIPLSDYPTTLLVVSDMQFNPSNRGYSYYSFDYNKKENKAAIDTNYEVAMAKLRKVFPLAFVNDFRIIWWNVNGSYGNDMPSTLDDRNTYFFSGFDGSIITLLLGGEEVVDKETNEKRKPTMEEMLDMALNQEILLKVSL